MAEKLRVGVIGTGGISKYHMMGYTSIPEEVSVVACCDLDEEKAKAWAKKYGVPAVYTDYREMLAKEHLDAVSVTTWNAAHAAPAIAALEAGCHVLCEKPMALNAAQAEEMLATSKRCGKLLEVGFVRRFGSDADALKTFIDEGLIGDIYYAKAVYLRRRGCPGGWFGDKAFSGGGPLIDLGVHVMDLVRYLAGSPMPVSAYGATFRDLPNTKDDEAEKAWNAAGAGEHPFNVEDFTSGTVRFDNGLMLTVEASFNLNIEQDCNYIELFGTKAGCRIDPFRLYTKLSEEDLAKIPENPTFDFEGSFVTEIRHFVDCCRHGTPCRAPAEDGVILMKMIDAIYESACTGHSVDIVC